MKKWSYALPCPLKYWRSSPKQARVKVRDAMRRAGVRKRPYVLRAYAETQLIIAESKGKISHPYLQLARAANSGGQGYFLERVAI